NYRPRRPRRRHPDLRHGDHRRVDRAPVPRFPGACTSSSTLPLKRDEPRELLTFQDDPDGNDVYDSPSSSCNPTVNQVLLAKGIPLAGLGPAREGQLAQLHRELLPCRGVKAERGEESCLEPSNGMLRREHVIPQLAG